MRLMKHSVLKRIVLLVSFIAAILIITRIASQFGTIANASTVAFCFLIVVALSAFVADLVVSITTSVVATACFNYFFLPPIGTWRIAAFDDWIALIVFLLTAIVISRLMAWARQNAFESALLKKTAVQLKEFGLWLLSIPTDQLTFSEIADEASRIFSFEYCSIHLRSRDEWQHFYGKGKDDLSEKVEQSLKSSLNRPFAVELMDDKLGVRYTQIRKEMEPVLVLAVKGDIPLSGLNTLACMIGLLVPEILREPHRISIQ